MKKTNKGITLIALIIIIVVIMALLVGVGIVARNILINKTEENNTTNQTEENETKNNTGKKYVDKSELKIGDYVNYKPAGTPLVTKYKDPDGVEKVQPKYSGYDLEQEVFLRDTKWRILDIKEDGTIELISETEVGIGKDEEWMGYLSLMGATGYNNGVELLNDICYKLYGTGQYATGARNLNIEDIQDKMNIAVWHWKDYIDGDSNIKFGETKIFRGYYAYYPTRWVEEVTGRVDDISTNGKLKQSDNGTNLIPTSEESLEKAGISFNLANENMTVTQTYWTKENWTKQNFRNPTYYEMLFKTEDNYYHNYWVASRCVDGSVEIDSSWDIEKSATFGIYQVSGNCLANRNCILFMHGLVYKWHC